MGKNVYYNETEWVIECSKRKVRDRIGDYRMSDKEVYWNIHKDEKIEELNMTLKCHGYYERVNDRKKALKIIMRKAREYGLIEINAKEARMTNK